MQIFFKFIVTVISGFIGWFIGVFEPTFPLLLIALCFILWDVESAYHLDKRVHIMFPDRKKRKKANFTSFKFGKVVNTIIKASLAILLMYATRVWVMQQLWDIPLEYIATAIVIAWQGLSVLENNASCPLPGDKDSRKWKILRNILVDKTERHFDIDLDGIKG